jgi:phosphoribosylanthranilate isomerase
MALRTLVKISGVNNLSDARYCAGMGVEMLGFSLEAENPNFVNPERYQEIVGWLSGVKFVAEFETSDLQRMNTILEEYPIHALQIARTDVLAEIKKRQDDSGIRSLTLIFKISLAETPLNQIEEILEKYQSAVKYFLIENEQNSPISSEDVAFIEKLAKKYPILLGYGISEKNISLMLANISPRGIALRGGNEIAPGLKDFDELSGILEAIEED